MPEDVLAALREQAIQLVASCGVEPALIGLLTPPRPEFWELSTNAAFELAARAGESPRRVAERLLTQIDPRGFDLIEGVEPSLVCQYGYELAQAFGQFYESSPALSAPAGLRAARLELVACTITVLGIVTDLLGIPVVERL